MEITTSQRQGRVPVTVFHIRGMVDSSTYQDFTNALRTAIDSGAEFLLLDLAEVSYMSSAGIRSLNEISLFLRKKFPQEKLGWTPRSTRLKLLNPSDRVAEVMKVSGVDSVFEFYSDLEQAIASF
jgi:anti-sigma B factor antagonist